MLARRPASKLETTVISGSSSLLPVSTAVAFALFASVPAPASQPPDHPMRFEYVGNGGNCAGCEWVSAMGVITSETPELFESFLARNGSFVPTIAFHSNGGDVRAALTLGMMIRERGLDTAIGETFEVRDFDQRWHDMRPGRCLSACVYALIGGNRRFIGEEDHVGVHQMYDLRAILMPDRATLSAADAARQQALLGVMVAYLQHMGIDPYLLTLATDTPPTDMTILHHETLVELGIDNMVSRSSGWSIEPYRDGVVASIEMQDGVEVPRRLTFLCRSEGAHILFSRLLDGIDPELFIEAIGSIQLYLDGQPMRTGIVDDRFEKQAWSRNGHLYLKLPLSDAEWDRIRHAEGNLSLTIDLPHVYGWTDGASVSLEGAGPFLDVARRNCLPGS